MIYRFRIILDVHDDVFRDIELSKEDSMEDFHNAITQSFGINGEEMASFYISDKNWSQGEEFTLFNMSDGERPVNLMSQTLLKEVVSEEQTKLIYVYDFLHMWVFLIELAEIAKPAEGVSYPNLIFSHGELPEQIPEKDFSLDRNDENPFGEFDPDSNESNDLGFEENWN